jgi:hypothetical protein
MLPEAVGDESDEERPADGATDNVIQQRDQDAEKDRPSSERN